MSPRLLGAISARPIHIHLLGAIDAWADEHLQADRLGASCRGPGRGLPAGRGRCLGSPSVAIDAGGVVSREAGANPRAQARPNGGGRESQPKTSPSFPFSPFLTLDALARANEWSPPIEIATSVSSGIETASILMNGGYLVAAIIWLEPKNLTLDGIIKKSGRKKCF